MSKRLASCRNWIWRFCNLTVEYTTKATMRLFLAFYECLGLRQFSRNKNRVGLKDWQIPLLHSEIRGPLASQACDPHSLKHRRLPWWWKPPKEELHCTFLAMTSFLSNDAVTLAPTSCRHSTEADPFETFCFQMLRAASLQNDGAFFVLTKHSSLPQHLLCLRWCP